MRMAKLQKATLDPSKISGRCGRLKCCLRYEYDTYQDMQRDLPPIGSEIITNDGKAKVLAQEILANRLLVQTEDMRRVVIDATEVLTVLKRGIGGGKKQYDKKKAPESASKNPTQKAPIDKGAAERGIQQLPAPQYTKSAEKSPPGEDAPAQDG